MRKLLIALLLVVLIGAASSATAQTSNDSDTSNESIEWIDDNVGIVDVGHDDGEAVVELRAEQDTPVVLSDAFGPMERGPIDQERRRLRGGETSTVRIPVSEYDGNVGVIVATEDVTFAVPIETSAGAALGTEHSTGQVLLSAGVGGVSGVGSVAVLLGYFSDRLLKRRDL